MALPSSAAQEEEKLESKNDKNNNKQDIKILFIDVDGVLNYSSMGYTKPLPLSDEHLKRIGIIVNATKCKIAFSTSWRLRKKSRKKLYNSLENIASIDMKNVYIGSTPEPNILNKSLMKRALEIKSFLNKEEIINKYNIIQFVAIDDIDLREESKECKQIMDGHFVLIDGAKGIIDSDVEKVIELLNKQ